MSWSRNATKPQPVSKPSNKFSFLPRSVPHTPLSATPFPASTGQSQSGWGGDDGLIYDYDYVLEPRLSLSGRASAPRVCGIASCRNRCHVSPARAREREGEAGHFTISILAYIQLSATNRVGRDTQTRKEKQRKLLLPPTEPGAGTRRASSGVEIRRSMRSCATEKGRRAFGHSGLLFFFSLTRAC